MAHVGDVERSIRFYKLLGFEAKNRMGDAGRTTWAWLDSGEASLMLTTADAPVVPQQQAILFYLYCDDVEALRASLLAGGVADGGTYCGQPPPAGGPPVVYDVTRPFYMPNGEIRVADPDGYCLLIGQVG